MHKRELTDLKNKEIKELKTILEKKRIEAAKVYMELMAGREKNLRKSKMTRLEVAQILTIIREKEIISGSVKTEEDK